MRKKILLILFFTCSIISCEKEQRKYAEVQNKSKQCVQIKSKKPSDGLVNDLYITISNFEEVLLRNNYLETLDKNSYESIIFGLREAFDGNIKKEEYLTLYNKVLENDVSSSWMSAAGFYNLPFSCLSESIKELGLQDESIFKEYTKILDQINFSSAYFDTEAIKKLIELTPETKFFEDIVYRAPIISILYLHLTNYYREFGAKLNKN